MKEKDVPQKKHLELDRTLIVKAIPSYTWLIVIQKVSSMHLNIKERSYTQHDTRKQEQNIS